MSITVKQVYNNEVVQSDWAVTDENSAAFIKNKPDLSSLGGLYESSQLVDIKLDKNLWEISNNYPAALYPNLYCYKKIEELYPAVSYDLIGYGNNFWDSNGFTDEINSISKYRLMSNNENYNYIYTDYGEINIDIYLTFLVLKKKEQ